MEILKTKSFESEGNDCWIKRSFSLVKSMGSTYLIYHYKVSGWSETDEMETYNILDMDSLESIVEDKLNQSECDELLSEWGIKESGEKHCSIDKCYSNCGFHGDFKNGCLDCGHFEN